jgi:hypothetical protein
MEALLLIRIASNLVQKNPTSLSRNGVSKSPNHTFPPSKGDWRAKVYEDNIEKGEGSQERTQEPAIQTVGEGNLGKDGRMAGGVFGGVGRPGRKRSGRRNFSCLGKAEGQPGPSFSPLIFSLEVPIKKLSTSQGPIPVFSKCIHG